MSDDAVCRCETFVHPRAVTNPPGLSSIRYRAGDFLSFRHALLLSRPGEAHLVLWRPDATEDLGVQLVEWWAYLADVLEFYNERTIAQAFLRTADDDEFLRNLTRILGYRPRPGLGARGTIAALTSAKGATTLPRGLQFQTKPGPGKQPQIYELDAETIIAPPDDVAADPVPDDALLHGGSLLLAGIVKQIAAGNRLLLTTPNVSNAAWIEVTAVAPEKDAHGHTNTRVSFTSKDGTIATGAKAADYRLLRSTDSGRPRPSVTDASKIQFEGLHRELAPGMPMVVDVDGTPHVVKIASLSETAYQIGTGTNPPTFVGTVADFTPALGSVPDATKTIAYFGWRDAGTPTATPATVLSANAPKLIADTALFARKRNVLLQPGSGAGLLVAAQSSAAHELTLTGLPDGATLPAPLHLLPNLLAVSRGKSVAREVVGTGDATLAGQDFVLRNSPVTYFPDHAARSGDGYSSTIHLSVNGVEWQEVPSFFGRAPDAQIYVTVEDAEGKTHVRTGDGVNGARLPSGVDVVVSYRYGSGAEPADAGTLTVINKAWPGLRAVRNPQAIAGGSDPDSGARLRQLAPRSVLTFGRAVSAADYETIIASAPGVKRVRAYWSFNPEEQRAMLTVFVGDDEAARAAAAAAIAGIGEHADANVVKAYAVPLELFVRLVVDPRYDAEAVKAKARVALNDPEQGLFGVTRGRIGKAIYRSAVYKACRDVEGVVSARSLFVSLLPQAPATFQRLSYLILVTPLQTHRFDPGEGGFFTIADDALHIFTETADVH